MPSGNSTANAGALAEGTGGGGFGCGGWRLGRLARGAGAEAGTGAGAGPVAGVRARGLSLAYLALTTEGGIPSLMAELTTLCPLRSLIKGCDHSQTCQPFDRKHSGAAAAPLWVSPVRCPATVALRWSYESRRGSAVRASRLNITFYQNELTKQERQTGSESLRAQSVLSKFGKQSRNQKLSKTIGSFYECVDPRSANQVLVQLEERGLVENLSEAVGHLVARADSYSAL
eukprot:4628649-Pleurochrysis_carterae.AAC.1